MQCSCIRTEKYLKICKSETHSNMGRDLRAGYRFVSVIASKVNRWFCTSHNKILTAETKSL